MAYQPEKITRESILRAVNIIESESRILHPSTAYDVIINGKGYPPKEVFRIAYELATGSSPGIIYGGEQINKYFRDNGFEILQKVDVWKLGCNWGKGTPSFYDFIKNSEIVITTDKYRYKESDLILITEGFTVYAIAKVNKEAVPVTSNQAFEKEFENYSIDYEDWVLYAEADWYELPKSDIFTYQLQQGIRKVQQKEIKDKTFDIWENRDKKLGDVVFYIKGYTESIHSSWSLPCLILIPDSWNDHGYLTTYELFYYRSREDRVQIGTVRIAERGKKMTELPSEFTTLDPKFGSLGQTLNYYQRLRELFPKDFKKVLRALNDCAFFENNRKRFENLEVFKVSLVRSSEAQLALENAKTLIDNIGISQSFAFNFRYQIPGALDYHEIDFEFNTDKDLPNRFFCLIGKNGTGKTKLLSQLANKLTDNEEAGTLIPDRPAFSKIISASFSYFDNFKIPARKDTSYQFIGVRTEEGLVMGMEMPNILWSAYKAISLERDKKQLWLNSIKNSLETEYFDFDLDELDSLSTKREFIERLEEIFSSGQKIIFQLITRLIAAIEFNSLLIFDEPETHLHPNISGRMLRVIKNIMDEYESFCILATHSPVIVQEVPSRFIRIVDRQENMPVISKPTIECFGENLSIISNSIFNVDEEKELYKVALDELATKYTMEEIEQIFKGKLSLNAKLYVQSKLRKL